MNQSSVWKCLKRAFKEHSPCHIVRLESTVGRGVPDVYFRNSLCAGFIEIKCGYDRCSPLQNQWHQEERAAGGFVCVLTVRPNRSIIINVGEDDYLTGVISWETVVKYIIELQQRGKFYAE